LVLVDYAHTPDALTRVLETLRPLTGGRLIAVFGCGGDRDAGKRPLMGRAVAEAADIAVITSDNPRTESPDQILHQIEPGVLAGGLERCDAAALPSVARGFVTESDRGRAIALAIGAAKRGDTVLIAGKGHEKSQLIGTHRVAFDDRAVAAGAIASQGGA
jgi:UDP-N-acetylmuramoyl-L-alanyl-D-glutamate--2,6-diaminopimelate ligase